MLAIRLQRIGKIKKPVYRLIVSEKARDTQDNFLELLGTYNPHMDNAGFAPKADRIKYWMEKGAQPSPTVHNLLVKNGVIKGEKQKAVYLTKKRSAKIAEKKKTAEAPAA